MRTVHTADDASNLKGHFMCKSCRGIITMHGNYKDKIPPCPWEKKGVFFEEVTMSEVVEEPGFLQKKKNSQRILF